MNLDEIVAGVRKAPRAPAGLRRGGAGVRLWRNTLSRYLLRADEVAALLLAVHTLDEIEDMRAELASSPTLAVTGGRGAVAEHPLLEGIRRHEAAFLKVLDFLGLDAADATGDAGSRAGSALVNRRWARRRGG